MSGKKNAGDPSKLVEEKPETTPSILEDQNDRGYYYDDAHGYQNYDPKIEEGKNEEPVADPE